MTLPDTDIERCMLDLLSRRAPTSSICPSDVARALVEEEDGWRASMPSVRQVASRLAREGTIFITQGDAIVDADTTTHGPIRLRRGPSFPAAE
ncbi:DUF3253 domain-containing protein [Paraburkholderia sp. BCC1886]|uniref:DUF3253 domain-containing protein n=1 Tax=Paraburkholderia sp. BCC1886 TaxID=2562670 RepID=UPI0011834799|nr:DUF3253 domain-containing protein [Paraburkholderia sp. BCC1886]